MKYLILLLLVLISVGCAVNASKKETCKRSLTNNYHKAVDSSYKSIVNNDTISFNSIQYTCAYSSFYTSKAMFDNYGKWDEMVFPENQKYPFLVWKNIDLLNNSKQYTVFTYGIENTIESYTAVMVFDEKEKDVLEGNSSEKEQIKVYIGELIRSLKSRDKDFYKAYWSVVDPERWDKMK